MFLIHIPLWAVYCIMCVLQYRKHGTAQHSTISAHSRKASTCLSECDNASKRTETIIITHYFYLVVMTSPIFSLIEFKYRLSKPAARGRHPIRRGRATVPRAIHKAAVAKPGERTSVTPEPGERRFFFNGLPEAANKHCFFFCLNGSARFSTSSAWVGAWRGVNLSPFLLCVHR